MTELAARGVAVDIKLVDGALELDQAVKADYLAEARELSGLENPNSVAQLTKWLQEETGEEVEDLRKATVKELLDMGLPSATAQRMLEIRQELGKTSNKKYKALATAVCADGARARDASILRRGTDGALGGAAGAGAEPAPDVHKQRSSAAGA